MNQPLDQFKKHSLTTRLSLFGAALLLVTIGITVNNARTKQEVRTRAASATVGKWDIFEFNVTNNKSYLNPFNFNEIELQAIFISPSGNTINFFGFYDGNGNGGQTGNVWKLRFMPDEVGTWTYTYTWTDGTPGSSENFNVVDTGLKGPLKIATDNPWYFMDSRGNPFNARGYDMPANPPNVTSPEKFNDLIDINIANINTNVIPNGYNLIMITAPGLYYSLDQVAGQTWWYYSGSYDFDRYDLRTWHNWDRLIKHYNANKIYVFPFALITQSEFNNVLDTTPRIDRFWRYYVARTGAYYNLLGNSPTWEWSEIWSESTITNWMTNPHNWNPFGTMLSIHDTMVDSFNGWGSFSMRQRQSINIFTGNSRTAGNHGGIQRLFVNKPILGTEDLWEDYTGAYGQPKNAEEVRRGAWGEMLAGIIPIYAEWENYGPSDGYGNGAGKAEILRMLNFIYSKTNYRKYQQLNNLVSTSDRQIASGIPGQEYLVYDEDGGLITINLSGTSNTFSVLWFDPKTGVEQDSGTIIGGASRTLTAPDSNDWVLHIKVSSPSSPSPTPTPASTPPYVTPTIYCLGSCPTLPPTNTPPLTVTPTNTPISTTPGQPTTTIPAIPVSQTPNTSPSPSIIPCITRTPDQTNTATANKGRIQERRGDRGISGMFRQLLQFLIQLINQLLQLLGIGGIPALPIQPVNPTPVVEPTQSTIPIPSAQPNQPTQSITPQPSNSQPGTPTLPFCEPSPAPNS